MLLSIQGGSNLGLYEINDAAKLVEEAVHPDALIIFGAVIDDSLGDEVRVTVIAAGFDEPQQHSVKAPVPAAAAEGAPAPQGHAPEPEESWLLPTAERPGAEAVEAVAAPAFAAESDHDGELDVPEFLR